MAVDLTGPQQIAESVLFGGVDACILYRKPATAMTFDQLTGTYVKATPVTVYTGKCAVRDSMTQVATGGAQLGAVPATAQRWTVKLPLGAPEPINGDVVQITAARDTTLIGKRLVVRDVGGGTFRVSRTLLCERWSAGEDQDWLA